MLLMFPLAMLSYAQDKAERVGVNTVQFHRAGFLTYEHQGNLADFVVTKNALHILPDFWKMAAFLRIAGLLKPKGVLYLRDVIFSFPPREYKTVINEWIQQVAKSEGQGWTAKDFETHVREEYLYTPRLFSAIIYALNVDQSSLFSTRTTGSR